MGDSFDSASLIVSAIEKVNVLFTLELGKYLKGFENYPEDAVIEDTTFLRNKGPEIESSESLKNVTDAQETKKEDDETLHSTNNQESRNIESDPKTHEKPIIKSVAEMNSLLDDFFTN